MIGHDIRPAPLADEAGPVTATATARRESATHRGPHAAIADAVEATIEGQKIGAAALVEVERGVALPDAFGYAILAAQTAWGKAGLLAAARVFQKDRERRPA